MFKNLFNNRRNKIILFFVILILIVLGLGLGLGLGLKKSSNSSNPQENSSNSQENSSNPQELSSQVQIWNPQQCNEYLTACQNNINKGIEIIKGFDSTTAMAGCLEIMKVHQCKIN